MLIQLSAQNATHRIRRRSSNDDAGLIAGVAIACVAALMLAALVLYRCRRSSSPAKQSEMLEAVRRAGEDVKALRARVLAGGR